MGPKVLRIGVLGVGRWGPNHVRNFSSLSGSVVVAVADTSPACLERIRQAFSEIERSECARDVICRDDVDAVVVATPTASHFELVQAALDAGKHVLCEKPLAASSRDAWDLAHLAEKCGRVLMVGHVFLFNPGIEHLAKAVREGAVGALYYVNAVRTNLGPFRYDVNAAWDLASHDVYIVNHVLQARPSFVTAVGGSYLKRPLEDIVFLTLQYPDGVLGHIHVSWLDPRKVRQITVVGERKMMLWDDLGVPGPVMVYDRQVTREPVYHTFGEFQLLAREGDVVLPRIPSQEPLAAQAREFVRRCACGTEGDARGSAKEGAAVVDILDAASRSLAHEGVRTEVRYGG